MKYNQHQCDKNREAMKQEKNIYEMKSDNQQNKFLKYLKIQVT